MDVPKLVSLDISGNKKLCTFESDGLSSLEALDVSFSENLVELPEVEYSALKYMSIRSTKISKIREIPTLLYLDISATSIDNLSFVEASSALEVLVFENMRISSIELNWVVKLPCLRSIQTNISEVSFGEGLAESSLSRVWFAEVTTVSYLPHAAEFSAALPGGVMVGDKFVSRSSGGSWKRAYLKLFGPWPIPPNDKKKLNVDVLFPYDFDDEGLVSNHIAGALFGMAVSDCISMYARRDSSEFLNFVYENPLDITWSQPRSSRRELDYARGGFTDNTAMCLLYMRSIVETQGELNVQDLSKRIRTWLEEGLPEHPGIGQMTHAPVVTKVVRSPDYVKDPHACARRYWIDSGCTKAGSSAGPRSVASGCFRFWDEAIVMKDTEAFCRMTHFDRRCVYCSLCFAMLISRLIQWRCGIREVFDLDGAIEDTFTYVVDITPAEKAEIVRFVYVSELDELVLSEPLYAGLQALGCATWVLRRELEFEDGVMLVATVGGDTRSNVAAVGAVLGAKWGMKSIPWDLIHYFWLGGVVFRDLQPFVEMMGLSVKLPTCAEDTRIRDA